MTPSDIIGIISIIVTTALTIVSLFIAVKALKQSEKSIKLTEKSIEDANRPYLACYLSSVDVGYFQKYLIFKNFGSTPAIITNIEMSNNSIDIGVGLGFDSLNNTTIAPGQKFITTFDELLDSPLKIKISYKDMNGNLSTNTFDLNTHFAKNLSFSKESSSSLTKAENDLRHSLHAMAKKEL